MGEPFYDLSTQAGQEAFAEMVAEAILAADERQDVALIKARQAFDSGITFEFWRISVYRELKAALLPVTRRGADFETLLRAIFEHYQRAIRQRRAQ